MDYERQKLKWNGWGWADKRFDFEGRDDAFWKYFSEVLGLEDLPDTPSISLEEVPLEPTRISPEALDELQQILSQERVKTDRFERIFHAVGRSYQDLIRLRNGQLRGAPDVIAYPITEDEVSALLAFAENRGVSLIPFGGGSSVVGGVEATGNHADRAIITVDMSQMNRVLAIDEEALTARVQPGIYGPQLEQALQSQGYTLGHYPQSFEFSTLGGWVAARSAGQQSNRFGAAAKFLVSARVLCPSGVFETKNFPNSSAGPDLNHLIAGSEGIFGIITEVLVQLHPVSAARDYRAYLFPTFEAGSAALREIVQSETHVAMLRLSDAAETEFYMTVHDLGKRQTWLKQLTKHALNAGVSERPCVLMVGLEGAKRHVKRAGTYITRTCFRFGGLPAGSGPGQGWYETRFETPYLRDELMSRGIGIDTLETATSWSNLHQLHQAVRNALAEALTADGIQTTPIVLGHISHSYQTGASLYFTYFFPIKAGSEVEQWLNIKRRASDAIRDHHGTISHHHGVGRDHVEWLESEKGGLGIEILRATKRTLDPNGLMNPGKLFNE